MKSRKEIVHMVVGNISLVQVQAIVASFLVSIFSLLVGFAFSGEFYWSHAYLLTASSMFTATTSCFVLGESHAICRSRRESNSLHLNFIAFVTQAKKLHILVLSTVVRLFLISSHNQLLVYRKSRPSHVFNSNNLIILLFLFLSQQLSRFCARWSNSNRTQSNL